MRKFPLTDAAFNDGLEAHANLLDMSTASQRAAYWYLALSDKSHACDAARRYIAKHSSHALPWRCVTHHA